MARQAQGVDNRGTRGDRRPTGQTHVAGGEISGRKRGGRVGRAIIAQHHKARAHDVSQEVGIIDGPATDEPVGEAGASFKRRGLDADIAGARTAEGSVGLEDEGRRRARRTGEGGHQEGAGIHRAIGAIVRVDDVEARGERDRADSLGGGDIGATIEV